MDVDALKRALALVPQHMEHCVREYLFEGIPPCRFLRAVLENDLHSAGLLGDDENQKHLSSWAVVLDALPLDAWGSHEKVQSYLAGRRKELGKPRP